MGFGGSSSSSVFSVSTGITGPGSINPTGGMQIKKKIRVESAAVAVVPSPAKVTAVDVAVAVDVDVGQKRSAEL